MASVEAPASSLTCFGRCCKWLLYAFNVLFMLTGIASSGVGVWAIADQTSVRIVVLTNTQLYVMGAMVLIGAGTAAIFVSIMGCCGARYENRCLLMIYAVSLCLVFVAEFSSGVIALAFYTQIETFANAEMREAVINKYGQGKGRAATDALDYMQNNFDCCGFEGDGHDAAQLYQISRWYHTSLLQVPASCCKRNANGDTINLRQCQNQLNYDHSLVNNVGCKAAVLEQGRMFATVISGMGIALSMMQLIGLVIAFCFFRRI